MDSFRVQVSRQGGRMVVVLDTGEGLPVAVLETRLPPGNTGSACAVGESARRGDSGDRRPGLLSGCDEEAGS
ncbi:MAG: hypothetical protein QXS54_08175 [Candidatus Methanomethylicaceae archaeon]